MSTYPKFLSDMQKKHFKILHYFYPYKRKHGREHYFGV